MISHRQAATLPIDTSSGPDAERILAVDGMGGVAGTTDDSLRAVQLSGGAEELFGSPAEDLIGWPLLSLLAARDRAGASAGVAEAAETGCAITLYVGARWLGSDPDASSHGCELLIVPLSPTPSCLFVFSPIGTGGPRARLSEDVSAVLARLARAAIPTAPAESAWPTVEVLPGQPGLTPREREVLAMVAAGHRVSAIARILFLSESTVRTHVAATERKLGVSSQRGLRELFHDDRRSSRPSSPRLADASRQN